MSSAVPLTGALARRNLTRRSVLALLGASAITPLLAACGGSDESPTENGSSGAQGTQPAGSDTTPASSDSTATTDSGSSGEPQPGGTLRLAIIEDPDSLDPHGTIMLTASSIMQYIYDRLVYIGEDRMPHPWVAESWEISEDGTQVTFTIREGIKFHDGTDLDAEAVKFTFDRFLDPATAAPAVSQLGTMESVEVVDGNKVRMNFSAPYAPLFTNLSGSYAGIISPTAVRERGDTFGHNPVGSGPFMLKEWRAGQGITLARNPDYKQYRDDHKNKGPAYLDEVEYRIIPEAATRLAALERGELDVSSIDVQQVDRIKADPNYQVITWEEATNMDFIEFTNKWPFTELAVRQAINYCIDRESIAASAWNGQATPNPLPIPVGVAGWDETLAEEYGYHYDLDKARQVLADAGFTPGPDGVLEKDGQRLEFTLMVYSGNEMLKTAAEIIQATVRQVGIQMDIQIMDFAAMIPILEAGESDCDLMRWTFADPVILSLLFKSPGWTNQVSDPELDALLEVADTTLDPDARIEAVHAAIKYILENAIIAPIVTDWILSATRSNVKDYVWDALGNAKLTDVWIEQA